MQRYLRLFLFLLLLLIGNISSAQIITTFAGGGTGGDGEPATSASLLGPDGGVFDKYGNYYFAQPTDNLVRKIDTSGIITTLAGAGSGGDGGPATNASLRNPPNLCVDTFCNIYISDNGDYKIRRIDVLTGIISTFSGNGIAGYSGDGGPATSDSVKFNGTNDIIIDKFGNFFIADIYNYRIRKISNTGIITTYVGNGIWGTSGDGGPATAAEISFPYGLAVDEEGTLYFADNTPNEKVRKVTTDGIITCIAGNGIGSFNGDGIPATNAYIDPIKVGVDKFGTIYIGDGYNKRLRYIDTFGYIYTLCGNGNITPISGNGIPATSSTTNYPSGISFDKCGNLYFTEVSNARIRKITFDSTCNAYTTNVPQLSQNELVIYPNPAVDELHIDGIKNIQKYRLLNIKNNIEQAGNLQVGSNAIDIRMLPPGMYFLEMIDEKGYKEVRKVVKD